VLVALDGSVLCDPLVVPPIWQRTARTVSVGAQRVAASDAQGEIVTLPVVISELAP
jgi:hypothetical protein